MKKWNVLGTLQNNYNFINELLKLRGITEKTDIELFVNPPLVSDYLVNLENNYKESLEEAKRIIKKAIKKKIPIVIHGDYDADGVCATAILFEVLTKELNYKNCYAFVPNRFEHGYGISEDSLNAVVEKMREQVGDISEALLITVDSGITAVEEVEYAKSLGFKVIITDHHQKPAVLPQANCVVWNDEIVGSAVSWTLGKALGSRNEKSIGLVALATVTDLQPLFGLNRSFVKEGLAVLNSNPPLGIKELMRVSGRSYREIDTYTLGWIVGPRINATGRMGDAGLAFMLLITDDEKEAGRYAKELNELNIERQKKTEEMYSLAGELVGEELPKVLITQHPDYHEGIIGLVAAKLVQKYYRPSIVLSMGEKYGKGSVRSIPGVDIISLLREFEDIFESLGGHPMAAGFTIKSGKVDLLKEKVESVYHLIEDDLLIPSLEVDLKVQLGLVDLDFVSEVEKLKPFGRGNKEPVFMSEKVGVTGVNVVGARKNHLSINLFSDGKRYRAIYFNGVEFAPELKIGDVIDIAYVTRRDRFGGKERVSIVVKDLRLN